MMRSVENKLDQPPALKLQMRTQALSQTAFAEDGARDSKLLLARDGRRGLRCSPVHPQFVNIRCAAAYVNNPGMHRAAPRCT